MLTINDFTVERWTGMFLINNGENSYFNLEFYPRNIEDEIDFDFGFDCDFDVSKVLRATIDVAQLVFDLEPRCHHLLAELIEKAISLSCKEGAYILETILDIEDTHMLPVFKAAGFEIEEKDEHGTKLVIKLSDEPINWR